MPDHPTCKTCKHWEAKHDEDANRCDALSLTVEGKHGGMISSAGVWVDDFGDVITGPDFSCLHHEPKEAT